MSFLNSAGVYDRIIDQSFSVSGEGLLAGGIVISAKRGSTKVTTVTSTREFAELYGIPEADTPSMHSAVRFLHKGQILSVVRVIQDAETAKGETANKLLQFESASEGKWGDKVEVKFGEAVGEAEGVFTVYVFEDEELVERFVVSLNPKHRDGYGANIFIENVINNRSTRLRVMVDPTIIDTVDLDEVVKLSGGKDDTSTPDSGKVVAAWEQFKDAETVPAQLLINAGWATPEVQLKMIEVAEVRRDAVAILDVPRAAATSVADMREYRKETLAADTSLAGLYGGWIKVYDQILDQVITIPPSGDVAGVFVNTVTNGERWDAPAGMRRGVISNTLGVELDLDEASRDMLYIDGINPISRMGGSSAVVWGHKTLTKLNSALNRFNVVNTLIWIRNRVKESLLPYVFQGNTKYERDSIKFMIDSFLGGVKARGGLYDFSVDTETGNTSDIIDNNAMIVDVYVQPVKTAEFIQLNLIVTRTGVSFA